jgi:hypothetical protein
MKMIPRLYILFVLVLTVIILGGCNNIEQFTAEDNDNIILDLKAQIKDLYGINYTISIENESRHVIKQNNVYLIFPIKTEMGSNSNEFKIEARENRLDIKPGEELILTVFAPKEIYEGNTNIDIENPIIQINGYINEVTHMNYFSKSAYYQK